jgi:ABC-type transport system substrate-binding protein
MCGKETSNISLDLFRRKTEGERKMSKKQLFATALILAVMSNAFATIPVKAWVYPIGLDDTRYEKYGPHVQGILIKLYNDTESEWTAMDNDLLDFEDMPLASTWIERWRNDSRFQLRNYGGDASYVILDINKNGESTLPDGTPNPAYIGQLGNPCCITSFRQALASLVNRSYVVENITYGYKLPMWTPVPAYMTTYVHPDIKPGGALENLTYGGYTGNVTLAQEYLVSNGFLYVPEEHPWRFWDKNQNGHYDVGEEFTIIFYARSDVLSRLEFANDYVLILTSEPIKINVDYRPREKAECSNKVFGEKEFHIYTGGWLSIGPDPDYLYDLYHSTMYWHPGKPPNYGDGYDALLDYYVEQLMFAPNVTYCVNMTMKFQERFAALAWSVPLFCESGIKAYRRVPVEEPGLAEWKDVVNEAGFGVNSWWTFLNLMKECEFYPPINVTYGFGTPTISWLNPFYSEWYWDREILNKIYDSCAIRSPYDSGTFVPQLAESWELGTWRDPKTGEYKSKLCVTLRSGLYWQDGTPVTVSDLAYTFVESVETLIKKGLLPPIWCPFLQYFKDVYFIDPLTIELLFDISVSSIWQISGILETAIIPKHIWKPIIDASTPQNPIVHQPQPDPNCVGSGPFRFVEYVPNEKVYLTANTPNNMVHGITSPGHWQYAPIFVNLYAGQHNIRFDPGYPNTQILLNLSVNLHNLWLNQSSDGILIVDKYVYVDNNLFAEEHGISLSSCHPEEEILSVLFVKCKHEVKVAVHVVEPAMLDSEHTNPWICQWVNVTIPIWITLRYDVAGIVTYYGYPCPDCKVDGKDIATIAAPFNTSPGDERWNSIADTNHDYKVDGKDLAPIAKYYGRW